MKYLIPLCLMIALVGCNNTQPPQEEAEATSASAEASDTVTAVAFNPEGAPTVELLVPSIVCNHCAKGVRETLVQVVGVEDVDINVEDKVVTVAVNDTIFNTDDALQALTDAKFEDASLVNAEATAPESPDQTPAIN